MALRPNTHQDTCQVQVTLEKFEERYAILRSPHGFEYRWPIKNLPESIQIGETIFLTLKTDNMLKDQQYKNMRELLTEMIN
ncbi:hypothetical protein HYV57_03205 [Candidatus Peregrinibacteria bacterium]|nr:hypothetical protein [Candidatus Peregrinibacteria bacterium]